MTVESSTQSFHLVGYLVAGDGREGFAVPVFAGTSSNRLVTQQIASNGRVEGFRPIANGGQVRPHGDETVQIAEGAQALWAYLHADGRLHVASQRELARSLATRLDDPIEPFLHLQIVEFCGLEKELPARWKAAYSKLARTSPRSAVAWRDVVIVPPSIRAAVLDAAKVHGLAGQARDLSRAVTVTVEVDRLTIELETDLYDAFAKHPAARRAFQESIRPLRQAFGFKGRTRLTSADARPERTPAPPAAEVQVLAIGDRAARIARHGVSDERSTNGSVRSLPRVVVERSMLVGLVQDRGLRLLSENEAFEVEVDELRTLIVLVAVDPEDPRPVHLAQQIAGHHRRNGARVVVVVPHLPGALATADEIDLWYQLEEGSESVWALSDLSPHTRQNLSYGGGHSAAAASGRFREFLALAADGSFPLVSRPRPRQLEVSVFSSAYGNISPRGLIEHAAMRLLTPSINLVESNLVVAALAETPPKEWLAQVVDKLLPSVRTAGTRLPVGLGDRLGVFAVLGAELRPVDLQEFRQYCTRELHLTGWNVRSDERDDGIIVDSGDGPWRLLVTSDEIMPAAALADGWHEGRQDLRFNNRTIGRRDFLAGVLFGSVPVNPNRIPVLTKILRGRWRTALSIARDRRLDFTDLLLEATIARMAHRTEPTRRKPLAYTTSSKPEVNVHFDAVQAVFRLRQAGGRVSIAKVQLDASGFRVAVEPQPRKKK